MTKDTFASAVNSTGESRAKSLSALRSVSGPRVRGFSTTPKPICRRPSASVEVTTTYKNFVESSRLITFLVKYEKTPLEGEAQLNILKKLQRGKT